MEYLKKTVNIKCLSGDSASAVRVDGILSKEVLVTTGVFQGNTLAPLFIIVLNFVVQKTEIQAGLRAHPTKLLLDLDFADDIILLNQHETEAIEHFQTIESSAKKVGLNIDYNKTKIMIRNVENLRAAVISSKYNSGSS